MPYKEALKVILSLSGKVNESGFRKYAQMYYFSIYMYLNMLNLL